VINIDNKDIYFCIGGHPAFAVPFFPNEKYEDYYLEFDKDEEVSRHYIDNEGFFDGRREVVLAGTSTIGLNKSLFRDDALIFKDLQSRKVTIRSHNHERTLSVSFNGFNYLGLWAKVGAPYVCIEPWLGCADTAGNSVSYPHKEGIIKLEKEGKFIASYDIEIG
jgi:galactose mutarotase-like enzyme